MICFICNRKLGCKSNYFTCQGVIYCSKCWNKPVKAKKAVKE